MAVDLLLHDNKNKICIILLYKIVSFINKNTSESHAARKLAMFSGVALVMGFSRGVNFGGLRVWPRVHIQKLRHFPLF